MKQVVDWYGLPLLVLIIILTFPLLEMVFGFKLDSLPVVGYLFYVLYVIPPEVYFEITLVLSLLCIVKGGIALYQNRDQKKQKEYITSVKMLRSGLFGIITCLLYFFAGYIGLYVTF